MLVPLKSRMGCRRCKQRKIKCDEQKPICGACKKKSFYCMWPLSTKESLDRSCQVAFREIYSSSSNESKVRIASQSLPLWYSFPSRTISSGYSPLRNDQEHRLLSFLSDILKSFARTTSHYQSMPDRGYEFTVALQEPWVRTPLLAFAAMMATTTSGEVEPSEAFEYYNVAIRNVRKRLPIATSRYEKDQMLVGCLFLGMLDAFTPHGKFHPLVNFAVVGQLLSELGFMASDVSTLSSQQVLYRIAYESYLFNMATSAFYYPEAYNPVRLYMPSNCTLGSIPSSVDLNLLCGSDINTYYILFELCRLTHDPDRSAKTIADLKNLDRTLRSKLKNYMQGPPTQGESLLHILFRTSTCLSIAALRICCAKALDDTLSTKSLKIQKLMSLALGALDHCYGTRLWGGHYCWVFSILLCAASTAKEFEMICEKMEGFAPYLHGVNLYHLRKLVNILKGTQYSRTEILGFQRDEVGSRAVDSLSFMFQHP